MTEMNEHAEALRNSNVLLSPANRNRIADLNYRLKNLEQNAEEKEHELASMGSATLPSVISVIPSSGKSSVDPPWERSLTPTKVPYFVKYVLFPHFSQYFSHV